MSSPVRNEPVGSSLRIRQITLINNCSPVRPEKKVNNRKIEKYMKIKIIMLLMMCMSLLNNAHAQWAVFDPTNLAQSIVNTTKNVVQTSTTAKNMVSNFQETVNIIRRMNYLPLLPDIQKYWRKAPMCFRN